MTQTAETVFRDFVTDGVPASGAHNPRKAEIREWGASLEANIAGFQAGGGIVFQTKAAMTLGYAVNQMAWVIADSTSANNGIYQKQGGSGAGSWTRVADLPYSFIVASDVGEGSPDSIQATSSLPISGSALVLLNVFQANTGSPVTVSFNGGAPLTIKSNSGNEIAPGGLQPNMLVMGRVYGSTFRIVTDQESSAIIAQAEAWAQQAGDEAGRAEDALAAVTGIATTVLDPQFPTRTAAMAFSPAIAPEYIRTSGYAVVGDNGGALYKKVASEPAHAGKFSITLSGGGDAVWYEIAEKKITLEMLGGMPGESCIAAMDAALEIGAEHITVPDGAILGRHEVNSTKLHIEGGKGVVFSDSVNAAGFWAGACGTLELSGFTAAVLPAYPDVDGVIENGAVFFGLLPGANITNLYIRDNSLSGGRIGISAGFENGRFLGRRCIIERNICSDQNGGLGGEGYGIHWANENNSGEGFILDNVVIRSGRHAFYFARNKRGKVVFSGNTAFDHRQNSQTHDVQVRAAIQISRSRNIVGVGNVVDGFYDSALWVIEDVEGNTVDATNIRLYGTTITNQKNITAAVWFGYTDAATTSRIRGVLLDGVTYEPNLSGAQFLQYSWGIGVAVRNVTIIYRGTTGLARMFLLAGKTEANTQDLLVDNVAVHLLGATGTYTIMRPVGEFLTKNMRARFQNIRVVENTGAAVVNNWEPSGAISNPGIETFWFPAP